MPALTPVADEGAVRSVFLQEWGTEWEAEREVEFSLARYVMVIYVGADCDKDEFVKRLEGVLRTGGSFLVVRIV